VSARTTPAAGRRGAHLAGLEVCLDPCGAGRHQRSVLVGTGTINPVLSTGRTDLQITTTPPPASGDAEWRPLQVEYLQVAMATEDRVAERPRVDLNELADEAFVMLRPTYQLRRLTEQHCRDCGFAPSIAFEGDDVPTVLGLVAAASV
jgi:DNA-binding transcriptional LysR family regulator